MKNTVQILSIEDSGDKVSKKTGNPYRIVKAHSIITTDDGQQQVGILNFPKGFETPVPGLYEVEFGMGVDFQTRNIGSVLKSLTPIKPIQPAAPRAPQNAGA